MAKSGRPTLKNEEKLRHKQITVWYSKAQYDDLKKLMHKANEKNATKYVRTCSLLGNKIIQKPSKIETEAVTNIRKIGVNFNQITMLCNADPTYLNTPEWRMIMDEFKNEITALYKLIIGK